MTPAQGHPWRAAPLAQGPSAGRALVARACSSCSRGQRDRHGTVGRPEEPLFLRTGRPIHALGGYMGEMSLVRETPQRVWMFSV